MTKWITILCWVFAFIILGEIGLILFFESVRYEHVQNVIQQERYTKQNYVRRKNKTGSNFVSLLGPYGRHTETCCHLHALVLMLRKWHDSDPLVFGIIFLFLYSALDIADSRWFIPHIRPVCNGEITDKQVRVCSNWYHIIKQEK